ncbi:MAG: hypothetical protein JRG97_10575 [Deltaproteobacteria bacterium]|nr:hypothetical protein [Deltaproteobacteria bacterium]MBW2052045.1 hypothetical protein [Deltaproteobacteria bacterium]MBW2141500.1 hypothetical protein [Deltaproteobacteria bacterium]
MKITDETQIKNLIQNPSSSQNQVKGSDFTKTLAKSMAEGSEKSPITPGTGQAAQVAQTAPVGKIVLAGLAESFRHVENTLSLLDRYAEALADPGQTLKQVSGLVKEMEQAADNLKGIGRSLPEGHAVKDLLDRTAITATVEAAKFNRGDYI